MERTKFEVEILREEVDLLKKQREADVREINKLKEFKASSVEKFIIIFSQLKDLQDGDKWIKRMIIGGLVSAVFSAIVALIMWAVQT